MWPLIPLFWTSYVLHLAKAYDIGSLRFTSGVTPADLLTASMAASCCSPPGCFSRGRMLNSNGRPPIQQSNALTTRPLATGYCQTLVVLVTSLQLHDDFPFSSPDTITELFQFLMLFTARNEVGARLCFHRRVWFCSQGGCLPQCMLGYPPGTDPPPPRSRHPLPPWRRACWEIRSTRGRYASYWNAIL